MDTPQVRRISPSQSSPPSTRRKLWWALSLLVAIAIVAFVLVKRKTSSPPGMHAVAALRQAAALAPPETAFLIATDSIENLSGGRLRRMVDDAAAKNPEFAALLNERLPARQALTDDELRLNGIDVGALAFAAVSNFSLEPGKGLVISIGVTDFIKAEAYVRREVAASAIKELGSEVCFARNGSRLYFCVDAPATGDATLQQFLTHNQNLATQPAFIRALDQAPEGDAAWYFNVRQLLQTLPDSWMATWKVFDNIESVAGSSSDESTTLQIDLADASPALPFLASGGQSREFASRFPRPVAAMSWSLQDVYGLAKAVLPAPPAEQKDSLEQKWDLLKDGAGGGVWYANGGLFPLEGVTFAHVNDEENMRKLQRERAVARGDEIKVIDGQEYILAAADKTTATAIYDHHIVWGKLERIEAHRKSSVTQWQPAVDGADLLAGELALKLLATAASRTAPADVQTVVATEIPDDLRIRATVALRGTSLVVTIDYHGIQRACVDLLAKAAPSLRKNP